MAEVVLEDGRDIVAADAQQRHISRRRDLHDDAPGVLAPHGELKLVGGLADDLDCRAMACVPPLPDVVAAEEDRPQLALADVADKLVDGLRAALRRREVDGVVEEVAGIVVVGGEVDGEVRLLREDLVAEVADLVT